MLLCDARVPHAKPCRYIVPTGVCESLDDSIAEEEFENDTRPVLMINH